MDETLLIALVIVLFNGAFDAIVVAWIAAKRSPGAFDKWVRSDKAKPALKVIATTVRSEVLPDLPTTKEIRDELAAIQADVRQIHGELKGKIDELTMALPEDFETRVRSMEIVIQGATSKVDAAATEILGLHQGIERAFQALDHKLGVLFGEQGAGEAALRSMAKQAAGDIEGAMQGSLANMDRSNPIVRQFYVWATKPIDEKWAAKNPFQAMLVQGGKAWFAQNVLPMFDENANAGSGLVRLQSTTKENKIL